MLWWFLTYLVPLSKPQRLGPAQERRTTHCSWKLNHQTKKPAHSRRDTAGETQQPQDSVQTAVQPEKPLERADARPDTFSPGEIKLARVLIEFCIREPIAQHMGKQQRFASTSPSFHYHHPSVQNAAGEELQPREAIAS